MGLPKCQGASDQNCRVVERITHYRFATYLLTAETDGGAVCERISLIFWPKNLRNLDWVEPFTLTRL